MQTDEFIESVCEQIKYKPIRKDIAEELNTHIQEIKEEYISNNIKENIAEEKSIEQMGNPKFIGKVLNKIHKPRFDYKLSLIVIMLLSFGFLISIIRATNLDTSGIEGQSIIRYIYFIILGLTFGTIIYFSDYRKLFKHSKIIYMCAMSLIIFTLILGDQINGTPVLYLKIASINPSTISLPLYLIAFVGFINNINLDKQNKKLKIIEIALLSIISVIFLLVISSTTSAIILFLTYIIVSIIKLLNCNINRKDILQFCILLVLSLIIISPFIINNIKLKKIEENRRYKCQSKHGN